MISCIPKCKYFNQDIDLEYFIIDEADKLINNNNIQDLHKIVTLCNDNTHILNISATFSNYVRDFIRRKLMRKMVKILKIILMIVK